MKHSDAIHDEEIAAGTSARDWLSLGRSSGRRAAEIVAGLRAHSVTYPEDEPMSTPVGRLFARLLIGLVAEESVTNATAARHLCITKLAEQRLSEGSSPRTIVELAAGLSGRGLRLAKAFPEAEVIEVDLPDVVDAKRRRVLRSSKERMPPNLRWVRADLTKARLADLLAGQRADMVIAEGLLPYFPPDWITELASSVLQCLTPEGLFIADTVSQRGFLDVEGKSRLAIWMFRRQAGKFKGNAESSHQAQQWFERAGYGRVQSHTLRDLADEYLPRLPVADVSFIVEAHKTAPKADPLQS